MSRASEQLGRFERELWSDSALVERFLREFPAVPEPERVIRCSAENVERAVCRAIARAAALGECWRIQIVR